MKKSTESHSLDKTIEIFVNMSFIFARLLEKMFFIYILVRRENGCFNYKSFKLKTYFFNFSGQCNLPVKKMQN